MSQSQLFTRGGLVSLGEVLSVLLFFLHFLIFCQTIKQYRRIPDSFRVDLSSSRDDLQEPGLDASGASLPTIPYTSVAQVYKSREKGDGNNKVGEYQKYQNKKRTKRKSSLLEKSVEAHVKNLIKEKGHVYVGKLIEYVRETYKPVINKYIKSLYKKKSDFFILLGNKKKYYTF